MPMRYNVHERFLTGFHAFHCSRVDCVCNTQHSAICGQFHHVVVQPGVRKPSVMLNPVGCVHFCRFTALRVRAAGPSAGSASANGRLWQGVVGGCRACIVNGFCDGEHRAWVGVPPVPLTSDAATFGCGTLIPLLSRGVRESSSGLWR